MDLEALLKEINYMFPSLRRLTEGICPEDEPVVDEQGVKEIRTSLLYEGLTLFLQGITAISPDEEYHELLGLAQLRAARTANQASGYLQAARTYFSLAEQTESDNTKSCQWAERALNVLDEYNTANKPTPQSSVLHAQASLHLYEGPQGTQYQETLTQAQRELEYVVLQKQADAEVNYWLGVILYEKSEASSIEQKVGLRERAIACLKESYRLNPDEDTLAFLQEIDEESTF